MPEWDGPPPMLPAFEGRDADGNLFRTMDRRQHRHLVVAFADGDSPALSALAAAADDIRENNGELVVVCGNGACPAVPAGVPTVCDRDGAIAAKYRPLLPDWRQPVVFVADRYAEIMATTDGTDPDLAEHVVHWLFSAERQCSL
jgi:hypothetical protein